MSKDLQPGPSWLTRLDAQAIDTRGGIGLLPGESVWWKPGGMGLWEFRAVVAQAEQNAKVIRVSDIAESRDGRAAVIVVWTTRNRPWVLWWTAGLIGAALLLWIVTLVILRPDVMIGGGTVAVGFFTGLWLIVKSHKHRPACPGLHCAGCKR